MVRSEVAMLLSNEINQPSIRYMSKKPTPAERVRYGFQCQALFENKRDMQKYCLVKSVRRTVRMKGSIACGEYSKDKLLMDKSREMECVDACM